MKQPEYKNVTTSKLVNKLCIEFAEEIYDYTAQRDNLFYKMQDHDDFIRKMAPECREVAIQTLCEMLADPKILDKEKDEIYEALLQDKSVPAGATTVVPK